MTMWIYYIYIYTHTNTHTLLKKPTAEKIGRNVL